MTDNVETAMVETLKNIQASIVKLRKEMNQRFEHQGVATTQRFEAFATEARKDRRNINGVMALLQAASGDFDERTRDMDERLSPVEDRVG